MASKAFHRAKEFRAFCRKMVKGGQINGADGGWVPYDVGKAMHRDMYFGYKLGATGKRKGPKVTAEVEA